MMNNDQILTQARRRYEECTRVWRENHEAAREDLKFLSGDQWPDDLLADRQSENRPCMVVNKLRPLVRRIVGDQRQNRIKIKVRPKNNEADPQSGKIFEGIIRDIEYESNAPRVYSTAYEQALCSGFGFFRILTEYEPDSFEQRIRIAGISDQFAVFLDPAAQLVDCSDARYAFVTEMMDKDVFERTWPGKATEGFAERFAGWFPEGKVRVTEYFWKEDKKRELALMEDGAVVELSSATRGMLEAVGEKPTRTRTEITPVIMRVKMTS